MFSLFKKSITVSDSADALLLILRKDFDRRHLERLSSVPGVDLQRAETEIVLLDFFAVTFALKFNRDPGWQSKRDQVGELLLNRMVEWWGNALMQTGGGDYESAFRVIDSRLRIYSEAIHQSAENSASHVDVIGEYFALNTLANDSFFGADGSFLSHRFPELHQRLLADYEGVIRSVGGAVFNHRVSYLQGIFDKYKLK